MNYFKDLVVTPINQSILILDIDGTLLADGEQDIDEATQAQVKKLLAQGNQIYLVSNGFSHKQPRNKALAERLGVTLYEPEYKKPLKTSVLPLTQGAGRPVIVIGDKFLTDGLLAVNLGVPYVAVRSLRSPKDPLYTRLAYQVDSIATKIAGSLARGPHYAPELHGMPREQTITLLDRRPLGLKTLTFEVIRGRRGTDPVHDEAENAARSLCSGLAQLGVPYRYNPWQHQVSAVVGVLADVNALRWALDQKKRGFIRTIIAGPQIVTAPTDENNLIKNPLIDKVILSSQWYKKWWMTFDQLFDSKAAVWASGVSDNGGARNPKGVCIVYSKNCDEKLFNKLIEMLWTHKLPIVVSAFGKFTSAEYLRLLKKARMLVYLSESQQQGVAMQEAWMADIPTLVWNRGYFMYQDKRFEDPEVGAPYLKPECGLSFTDDSDFERKLIEFMEKYDSFTPRGHALAHHTDASAARKFIDIAESAEGKS